MEQDTLFPEWNESLFRQARANKDEAMGRVEQHTDANWGKCADEAVIFIAKRRPEFTADPVWRLLEQWKVPPPHEPRALGPVMLRAVKAGICVKTDRVTPSVLPQRNSRPIAIYRSRICETPHAAGAGTVMKSTG